MPLFSLMFLVFIGYTEWSVIIGVSFCLFLFESVLLAWFGYDDESV